MRENGEMSFAKVLGDKSGPMALVTKETGLMTRLTVSVNFSMQMAMSMKANGKMIKLMARELTLMQTVQDTRETGEMTSSTASVLKLGLMVLSMRANTLKARKTERES